MDSIHTLAQEQRQRGVAALRSGNYAQAIVSFEAAIKLDASDPDLTTLLEVAKKLQAADKKPVAAAIVAPEPPPSEPPVTFSPPPSSSSRRVTQRNRRDRKERPAEAQKALLLVTTTPDKLLLEIDGRPAEMTPARVEVDPGTVRVVIRRGQDVLLDRKVSAAPGAVVAIQEDFSTAQPPEPAPKAVVDRAISQDDKLDLVELIDRDRAATPAAARTVTPPPPSSGQPRVVVYLPSRNGGALEAALRRGMNGVEVHVVARSSDLSDAIQKNGTDAVIASPAVLRDHGLTPGLRGVGAQAEGTFLAASLQGEVQRARLPAMTLGVVDELGRKQTTSFVADLVGASAPPKLRRVGKVEDLLPLLQFKMVDAVLVREKDFKTLEHRTEQKLYTLSIEAKGDPVAVAFIAGGRRQAIERAVLALGAEAKENLGVGRWTGQ